MSRFIIAAASLLLWAALAAAEPWNHAGKDVIHVGGKVVCQDCTQGWNEWVNGAKPLKGKYMFFLLIISTDKIIIIIIIKVEYMA